MWIQAGFANGTALVPYRFRFRTLTGSREGWEAKPLWHHSGFVFPRSGNCNRNGIQTGFAKPVCTTPDSQMHPLWSGELSNELFRRSPGHSTSVNPEDSLRSALLANHRGSDRGNGKLKGREISEAVTQQFHQITGALTGVNEMFRRWNRKIASGASGVGQEFKSEIRIVRFVENNYNTLCFERRVLLERQYPRSQ